MRSLAAPAPWRCGSPSRTRSASGPASRRAADRPGDGSVAGGGAADLAAPAGGRQVRVVLRGRGPRDRVVGRHLLDVDRGGGGRLGPVAGEDHVDLVAVGDGVTVE